MNDRHIPVPGEIYRHFKGKLYQICTVAEHTETGEKLVIYQALYGDFRTYARPLPMFLSPVEHGKYPEVIDEFRFTQVKREELQEENAQEKEKTALSKGEFSQVVFAAGNGNRTEEKKEGFHYKTTYLNRTPQELFELFLDADTYKEKLELLGLLKSNLTRSMMDSIAASLDVVLHGKSMDEDLYLIEDHLRIHARYELRR